MSAPGRGPAYAPIPGVIAVGAGKGGVGTSLVSALLALEAARLGEQVLLVDADENVGSLHMMLGLEDAGPGVGALRGGAIEPEDLLKFGLIPEFVGRLPVVVSVNELDLEMMTRILVEPNNAVTRQFQRLFDLDGVELQFTDGALSAIASR